jgi:hypothetical protein
MSTVPCENPLNEVLCRNAVFDYMDHYGTYAFFGLDKIFWAPRDTAECKACTLSLIKAKLLMLILEGKRV